MVETREERKRRLNREAAARYRARKKKQIARGDKKAIKQKERDTLSKSFASAKSFIRKHATKTQISELRDVIAWRANELYKKSKK